MSNVQTLLRKRSITPMQTGKMILEDFLQARKMFMQDPSSRGGLLDGAEKELLLARSRMSPNRKDTIVFLILRDFLHEMSFRQQLAKQSFDLSYARLSHMVELTTIAERDNTKRIERKTRTSTPLFEAHRAESLLNGKNIIQEHVKSMKRSIATLTAVNTGLACVARAVGMPSIEAEMVGMDGFMYDVAELEQAVSVLLGVIVRDGREPAPVLFSTGVPASPADWLSAIELSTVERIEAKDLVQELRGILSVNLDLDQTAIKLYEKTFNLQKILKDGIADLEKLTNNLLKTHEIGGQ